MATYRWDDSTQPTRWPVRTYKEKLDALLEECAFDAALEYVKTFETPEQRFVGLFMVFMEAEIQQAHVLAARLYPEIKCQGAGPRLLSWLFSAVAMGADLPMMKQFVADGVKPTEKDLQTAMFAQDGLLSHPPQENALACIHYLLSQPNLPGRALVRHADNVPRAAMVKLLIAASTQDVINEALVVALANPHMNLPRPGAEPTAHERDYEQVLTHLSKRATPGIQERAKESVKNQRKPGKSAWLQAHMGAMPRE